MTYLMVQMYATMKPLVSKYDNTILTKPTHLGLSRSLVLRVQSLNEKAFTTG